MANLASLMQVQSFYVSQSYLLVFSADFHIYRWSMFGPYARYSLPEISEGWWYLKSRITAKKQSSNLTLGFTGSAFTDAIRSPIFQLLVIRLFAAHLRRLDIIILALEAASRLLGRKHLVHEILLTFPIGYP